MAAPDGKVVEGEPAKRKENFGTLGPSLLDIIDGRMAVHPRNSVTRLMYAARFTEGQNDTMVSSDHGEIVEELSEEQQITGMLLLHDKSALHLIETPCDTMIKFLQKLQERGCLDAASVRIVMSTEDCPDRCFREWSEHKISAAAEAVDLEAEDPCDAGFELYTTLLKIYDRMSKKGDDDVMESNSEMVPSHDRVSAFADSAKYMSLDEYLSFYGKPVHLELGSDRVWPVQSFMLT